MLRHDEAQELHRIIGQYIEAASPHAVAVMVSVKDLDRARELAALAVADTMEEGGTSTPSPVSHNPCLQGKVLIDGAESDFLIPLDNDSVGFSQWGAPNEVLWGRVDLLDSLSGPAREWWADNKPEDDDE